MGGLDLIFAKVVDELWPKYQKRGQSTLKKEETRSFLREALVQMTDEDLSDWSEEWFEKLFTQSDKNLNGTIDKRELIEMLNKMNMFHKKMNEKHFNLIVNLKNEQKRGKEMRDRTMDKLGIKEMTVEINRQMVKKLVYVTPKI